MGKKLLDSKILYMVLAAVLAIVLWFYVTMVRGEQKSTSRSACAWMCPASRGPRNIP